MQLYTVLHLTESMLIETKQEKYFTASNCIQYKWPAPGLSDNPEELLVYYHVQRFGLDLIRKFG